jgi:hypothetical protein
MVAAIIEAALTIALCILFAALIELEEGDGRR